MAQVRRPVLIVLALLAALPAAASASSDQVIKDCTDDGKLSAKYSNAELSKALKTLPADVADYTDCKATIRKAMLRVASGGSSDTATGDIGVGDESKLNDDQRKAIKDAVDEAKKPKTVRIGPGVVEPGAVQSSSSIPAPLIVVLVLAGLGGLAGAGELARRFVSRRNDT